MHESSIILVALLILAFALVSRKLEAGILTAPIFFTVGGYLVGPHVLKLCHLDPSTEVIRILAEFTLAVLLFADASKIDVRQLRKGLGLPVRLLSVGLPLTIVGGGLAAKLIFPEFSLFEAALLGAILAPTDAALGQAVVSSESVPLKIRQTLTVESGLNDGISVPFVLFFAACASGHILGEGRSSTEWMEFVGMQILVSPLIGAAIGLLGGWLIRRAAIAGFMSRSLQQIGALCLAVLAFSCAELIEANGFIAAFCAGIAVGCSARELATDITEFTESEGTVLMYLGFLVFGVSMVGPTLESLTMPLVLYALLSLTLIRMLPVAISLLGTKVGGATTLFTGWFGPRGIASILYAVVILVPGEFPHRSMLLHVTAFTVLCSIVAHGVSANPLAKWYGATAGRSK